MLFQNILWGVLFIVLAGTVFFMAGETWFQLEGSRRFFGFLGSLLLAFGGVALLAAGVASTNGFPTGLEWPVGEAQQVLFLHDGRHIAVHQPTDRIQVYSSGWRFLHGWSVPGDLLRVKPGDNDTIEAWAERSSRQTWHHVYSADGKELRSEISHGDVPDVPMERGDVPTPYFLYPLAYPLLAGVIAAFGFATWRVASRGPFRTNDDGWDSPSDSVWDLDSGGSSDD